MDAKEIYKIEIENSPLPLIEVAQLVGRLAEEGHEFSRSYVSLRGGSGERSNTIHLTTDSLAAFYYLVSKLRTLSYIKLAEQNRAKL